jgi:signal peptidase
MTTWAQVPDAGRRFSHVVSRVGSRIAATGAGAGHATVVAVRDPRVLRGARRWCYRAVFLACLGVAGFAYVVPLWYQVHGQRLLVVTSGSMRPAFAEGDAVVVAPLDPSQLRTKMVVSFWPIGGDDQNRERLVTHRIKALVSKQVLDEHNRPVVGPDGRPLKQNWIETKGDSNKTSDENLTPVANVRGVVRGVHHGWGRALVWTQSPTGRLLTFGPPLLALLASEALSWWRPPVEEPLPSRRRRRRTHARAVALTEDVIAIADLDDFETLDARGRYARTEIRG